MTKIDFKLSGKRYSLTRQQVDERLSLEIPKPTDKYYVMICGRPYPPKQVLAAALSIPLSHFTTMAANAILTRLGYEVTESNSDGAGTKTESERLFEVLLGSRGLPTPAFHPHAPGVMARPDYLLELGKTRLFFEVKEFQPSAEDFQPGGGAYDPYEPVRRKIQDGLKNFAGLKSETCGLVLYNAGKPLVDLRWQFVYAAMLGNLSYFIPFNQQSGEFEAPPELAFSFSGGGEMLKYDPDGVPVEPYKRRISAIVVLEQLPVGKRRFELSVRKREANLNRELSLEEYLNLASDLRGTDADISLRQLRVVVCTNPYGYLEFPADIFRGPYDERYGSHEGRIQRKFAGEHIQHLETELKAFGLARN